MNILRRLKMSIEESRHLEDVEAAIVRQQSDIDYIAMMSDIDIIDENEDSSMKREGMDDEQEV